MKGKSINFMLLAFQEAKIAYNLNEVPIGAVVVKNCLKKGTYIGRPAKIKKYFKIIK